MKIQSFEGGGVFIRATPSTPDPQSGEIRLHDFGADLDLIRRSERRAPEARDYEDRPGEMTVSIWPSDAQYD